MRYLTDHTITEADRALRIAATDEPSHGGAHHHYRVLGNDETGAVETMLDVRFQNGPIAEHGVNGVTQEVLVAIVLDRLRSFQKGPFASRENALAITKFEEGLHWLQQRTLERMRRGVEGTSEK